MANLEGQSLGRYHILEQLGEGGMATVYKAFDTRLERDVAVKVIRVDQFAPAVLERILKRFEREAKALARLTHPNIVHVNDFGEQEGVPYLVMDYLPGGTLKQRLGRPMPWEDATRILLPVARALQFAHGHGIIHRDVKPSNILITLSGEPMLSDFGIAKILESDETTTLTGTGIGVGTPEYMAPEQWTGQTTSQSDIYSLGVVFYEMVTGRKPFMADTPAAILLKQATESLPRPAQYVSDIPDKVEKLLLKALARLPQERYPDISVFANALEELVTKSGKREKSFITPTVPPKITASPDTAATIDQEDTQATQLQETTHDVVLPPPPHQSHYAPAAVSKQATQKPMWWPWIITGMVIVVSIGIVFVISIGFVISNQNAAQQLSETATEQAYQMYATATAQANQSHATATAQAHLNLINSWDLIISDQFNDNQNNWTTGDINTDLYTGNKDIYSGKMVWTVNESTGFVHWDWPTADGLTNYYISVDARRISGPLNACYGLLFRGDGSNYYIFEVCDDQTYRVNLHSDENGWETLIDWTTTDVIKPDQVNKLAVAAQGSYFEFYINDQLMSTLNDSRWASGYAGIMIEVNDGDTATFEFDNFVLRTP